MIEIVTIDWFGRWGHLFSLKTQLCSQNKSISKSQVGLPVFFKLSTRDFECSIYTSILRCSISSYVHVNA